MKDARKNEHSSLSSDGKEMYDMSVVARDAHDRDAGLPALLCEGGCGTCSMHGAERTAEDARDDLPEVGEMGEAVTRRRGRRHHARRAKWVKL